MYFRRTTCVLGNILWLFKCPKFRANKNSSNYVFPERSSRIWIEPFQTPWKSCTYPEMRSAPVTLGRRQAHNEISCKVLPSLIKACYYSDLYVWERKSFLQLWDIYQTNSCSSALEMSVKKNRKQFLYIRKRTSALFARGYLHRDMMIFLHECTNVTDTNCKFSFWKLWSYF